MGFKVPKKTLTLQFSDLEYEGLEIVTRMPTIREAMEAEALEKKAQKMSQGEQTKMIFTYLMRFITSWNLEDDDGVPVPLSIESFIDFETDFGWMVFYAFANGSAGVPAPLDEGSPSGEISQVAAVPMEAL